MADSIAPTVLSLIQNGFVEKLSTAYDEFAAYAMILFAIVATIEIALFGLMWAMRRDEMIATFLLKIIKLGVIFLVISAYPYLLSQLINGFTQVAFSTVGAETSGYIFNPTKLWQFGYDSAISMLKLAADYGSLNVSMGMIYIVLGFGVLILFSLIGAQIVLLVVGFYVVSLLALLFIPLGAFSPVKNLFERALQGVIKLGARVFALILIIGVAVSIWSQFSVGEISSSTTLDQPLGLFFSALVVWVLTLKVPAFAADLVGHLGGRLFEASSGGTVTVSSASQAPVTAHAGGAEAAIASVAAASVVAPSGSQTSGGAGSLAQAAAIVPSAGSGGQGAASSTTTQASTPLMGQSQGAVAGASAVQRGISNKTLHQLKSTFKQAIKENEQQRKK